MKSKKVLFYGLAAVAFTFAVAIIMSGGPDHGDTRTLDLSGPEPGLTTESTPGGMVLVKETPEHALRLYEQWAQYPPFSRPLRPEQADLLDPYRATRPAGRVVSAPAQGCPKPGEAKRECDVPMEYSDVSCSLYPEQSMVVGRTDVRVFLRCFKKGKKGEQNLLVDNIETSIFNQKTRKKTLPPIASGDSGSEGDVKANDRIYTIVSRPSARDWGWMNMTVGVMVNNLKHTMTTSWFVTPHKVAEFGSRATDSISDGHLKVAIPITVTKPGYYVLAANLLEKGGAGRAVASSSWKGDLAQGRTVVEFTFWGKVIRDSSVDGPYVVQNIRGHRLNMAVTPGKLVAMMDQGGLKSVASKDEPELEYMADAPRQETRAYNSSDFSDRPWQGPEKEDRLKYLRGLVAEKNDS